jgi:streptogramin lyase
MIPQHRWLSWLMVAWLALPMAAMIPRSAKPELKHAPGQQPVKTGAEVWLLLQEEPGSTIRRFGHRARSGGIHPFFDPRENRKVGDILLMDCSFPEHPGACGNPVASPLGEIYWKVGDSNIIGCLTPRFGLWPLPVTRTGQIHNLFPSPHTGVVYHGPKVLGFLAPGHLSSEPDALFHTAERAVDMHHSPEVAVMGAGDIWCATPDRIIRLPADDMSRSRQFKNLMGQAPAAMAFEPVTGSPYWIYPGLDLVETMAADGQIYSISMPRNSRPSGIALGPDGHMWVTFAGLDEVAVIHRDTLKVTRQTLPRVPGAVPLGPPGIALGPDQAMWVTCPAGRQILRITMDTRVESFAVPRKLAPTGICCSRDGRLIFATEDGRHLGSIVAVVQDRAFAPNLPWFRFVRDAEAAEQEHKDQGHVPFSAHAQGFVDLGFLDLPGAGEDAPAEPRPPGVPKMRKLSRASRHRLHDEILQRFEAEAKAAARSEALPQPAAPAEAAAPPPAPAEERDPVRSTEFSHPGSEPVPARAWAGEPPLAPLERMARCNVYCSERRAQHIWEVHGHGFQADRSQFHATYSHRDKILDLIARGIEAAHRDGLLGKELSGNCHVTYCAMDQAIGFDRNASTDTRWVKVVTDRYLDVDGQEEFYLRSAYPETPYGSSPIAP